MKTFKFVLGFLCAALVSGSSLFAATGYPGLYTFKLYPGENLLGYQLDKDTNNLNTFLPLGSEYNGSWVSLSLTDPTAVATFNGVSGQWSSNYALTMGQTLNLHLVGPSPTNFFFYGVVPTNYYDGNALLYVAQYPGPGLRWLAYPVAFAAGFQQIVGRAPIEGDWVATNNGSTQVWYTNRFSGGAWSPRTPALAIGQSAFFNLANLLPSVSSLTKVTTNNMPLIVPTAAILSVATDSDGGTLRVAGVSATSTNGGSVGLKTSAIIYHPPWNYSGQDQFSFMVADGQGGYCTNVVSVTINNAAPPAYWTVPQLVGPNLEILFAGIPGETYTLEWADVVTGPWQKLTNCTAPSTPPTIGVMRVTDPLGAGSARFYRTAYPAY